MALQPLMREDSRVQLDKKLVELKKVRSQVKLREERLSKLFGLDTKKTTEQARLRKKDAAETAETTKLESVETENEWPDKCAKVVCGVEDSLSGL